MSENVIDDEFDEVGQMDAEDYGELKQAHDALLAERDALREAGEALAEQGRMLDVYALPQEPTGIKADRRREWRAALRAWRAATGEDA